MASRQRLVYMGAAAVIRKHGSTVLGTLGVVLWLVALFMLASAAQNSAKFDRWLPWILLVNIAGLLTLVVLLAAKLSQLVRDYRRHVPAVVPHQLRELRCQQHHEGEQTRDVDQQNPRQPAVEFGGILRGRSQHEQRDQPQHHAQCAEHGRTVFTNYGCSAHVYQSLSRCHSLTQNISTRRLNGTLP